MMKRLVCGLLFCAALFLGGCSADTAVWNGNAEYYRYLKVEQADGTPFTRTGAVKIRQLGISTIVMPIVATIVSAVIYGCFQAVDTANSAIYAAVD